MKTICSISPCPMNLSILQCILWINCILQKLTQCLINVLPIFNSFSRTKYRMLVRGKNPLTCQRKIFCIQSSMMIYSSVSILTGTICFQKFPSWQESILTKCIRLQFRRARYWLLWLQWKIHQMCTDPEHHKIRTVFHGNHEFIFKLSVFIFIYHIFISVFFY